MKCSLIVVQGKPQGMEIPLRGPQFVIGREKQCNLRPNSDLISKLHCAFLVAKDGLYVKDLGSTNGTLVNGDTIKAKVRLKDGDHVKVGALMFKVKLVDEPAPVVAPSTSGKPSSKSAEDNVLDCLLSADDRDLDEPTQGSTVMDIPAQIAGRSQLEPSAPPPTRPVGAPPTAKPAPAAIAPPAPVKPAPVKPTPAPVVQAKVVPIADDVPLVGDEATGTSLDLADAMHKTESIAAQETGTSTPVLPADPDEAAALAAKEAEEAANASPEKTRAMPSISGMRTPYRATTKQPVTDGPKKDTREAASDILKNYMIRRRQT